MTKKCNVWTIMFSLGMFILIIGCASKDVSTTLTLSHLEQLIIEDFTLLEEDKLQVIIDDSKYTVANLIKIDKNLNNTVYFFLSTAEVKKQLLVVLNYDLQKVQWGDYYAEYCFFDPEELVAIVVEPFPKRHQNVVLKVYDFAIDYYFNENTDLSFWPGTSEGDKQAYYQLPVYEKNSLGYYTIFWKQAHYSFADNTYSFANEFRGSFLTSGDESTLDELDPLEYSMERWIFPKGYSPFGRNVNGVYEAVIISPKNEEPSWDNYQIYITNKKTSETEMIPFANIFEYQDPLISVIPAKNRDDRVAFIVETEEFSYDFYFDPKGEDTDIFLRPSSFVRLYPK